MAGKELPAHDSGSNNQYFLREVDASYARSREAICYQDSMIYIAEKGETEPARILITLFKDKEGNHYELFVYTPTIEKQDLRLAIFHLLAGLFVVLFVAILLINVWVFHRSMKPFYQLMDWLDKFRLGKQNEPLEISTYTTEFRKLNEAVARYAAHSEEMFEQQKLFIGNASHEIQTPLAVCRNRLEMLMEDETLGEQQMEEKGDFRIRMNVTLATMLMTNLLKNAFVHNVDGGRIHIIISASDIRFGNTGEAVPLDEKRVFERFYQGGRKKEGSTGLGLAIVDAICRQCRMQIRYRFDENMHWFEVYR